MKRSEQGGAIVGFLIASVVLALLLVGGVYAVRHHPEWVASGANSAPTVSKTDTSDQKSTDKSSSDDKATKDQSKDQAPSSDSSSSDSTAGGDTSSPATPNTTTPTTPDSTNTDTPSGQPESALPHTGPADAFLSLIGVGSLTVATAAYVRSRRQS